MALVACDTAADPGKLQRKLMKRWGKRCARFLKRAVRKEKLANLDTVLQRVLQDHGETTTIGELRAVVGQEDPAPSPSLLQDSQQTRQTRRCDGRLGRVLRGRGL